MPRAISATIDWTAKPCGMFETERNQPMRVCASASPFSQRRLGISNGLSTKPMPSSIGTSCLASAVKVDRIVGATLRCRHATTLPLLSKPGVDPLDRHGVVVVVLDVVLARPDHLDRRARSPSTAARPRSRSRISTCVRTRRPAASCSR